MTATLTTPGAPPAAQSFPLAPAVAAASAEPLPAPARKKLSYKDQRELELLPARIEQLEADVAARTAGMQDPAFYRQEPADQQRANAALVAAQHELDAAYARWEALDG